MAFWRAPGSILKAPDSILEASGLDFKAFLDRFFWQKVGKKVFLISRFGLVGSVLNSWRFGVRFFEVVTA